MIDGMESSLTAAGLAPPTTNLPAMTPKIYEGPSAYGPSNDSARSEAAERGLTPIGVNGIAAWFGVEPNTVSRSWIAERDAKKDPAKKFPEPTWPELNLYATRVIEEWGIATGRLSGQGE
jgi:HAMP domain-containing protein